MDYDISGKDACAQWFGLPYGTYHWYKFEDWMIAKSRLGMYLEDMYQNLDRFSKDTGINAEEFSFSELKDDFVAWAKRVGHQTVQPYIKEDK